jgi:hypothetical protein
MRGARGGHLTIDLRLIVNLVLGTFKLDLHVLHDKWKKDSKE